MKDWLLAGCVYVPAFIAGRVLSDYFDPFLCGWFVAGAAIFFRFQGPMFFRAEKYR